MHAHPVGKLVYLGLLVFAGSTASKEGIDLKIYLACGTFIHR